MKVRCISPYPNKQLIEKLGPEYRQFQEFHITVGKEYLVLALDFMVNVRFLGTGVWIQYVSDYGRVGSAPMGMFEITDGRVSGHWEARAYENGSVSLSPPSFYREYYHDDLSEDIPELVEDFKRVYALLESEFEDLPASNEKQ